jgi:hypothetical protein
MKSTSKISKSNFSFCLFYSIFRENKCESVTTRICLGLYLPQCPRCSIFSNLESFQPTEQRIQATETARWEMKWQTFGLEILGISTMASAYCSIVSLFYGLRSLPRPAFYTYLFGFLTWLPYSENHQVVMDCCIGENKYFPCQGVNISNSTLLTKYLEKEIFLQECPRLIQYHVNYK